MAAEIKPRLSFDEYLAIESKAEYKSEFVDGRMHGMAGASPEHNLIVVNVGSELRAQLKSKHCRGYASDMLLRIEAKHSGRYPDVTVVCGESKFYKNQNLDALLNPTLLVEVLSPSTENYDRGIKAEEYRSIITLKEYLLIAQDRCHLEQYLRQSDNQWLLTEFSKLEDNLFLPSINCHLLLREVYENVEWAAPEE
jgi:Uma2 family endonuclease